MSLDSAVADLQKKLNRKDTFEDAVKRLTWIVKGGEYENATCQQQQAVRLHGLHVHTRGKNIQQHFLLQTALVNQVLQRLVASFPTYLCYVLLLPALIAV